MSLSCLPRNTCLTDLPEPEFPQLDLPSLYAVCQGCCGNQQMPEG